MHAEAGLMKRRWNDQDINAMRRGFLGFSDADVQIVGQHPEFALDTARRGTLNEILSGAPLVP